MAEINLRERRLDVYASLGYSIGIHIEIEGDEPITPSGVVARVVNAQGVTVADFEATPGVNVLDLTLTPEQTRAIGTVSGRWFLVVAGRPWVGGVFDLSSPGVDPSGFDRAATITLMEWTVHFEVVGTSGSGGVVSVNGQTGVVVLAAADVGAATPAQVSAGDAATLLSAQQYTDTAIDNLPDPPAPPVTSVNEQTGDVELSAADVGAATPAQVAGAISAITPASIGAATSGDLDNVFGIATGAQSAISAHAAQTTDAHGGIVAATDPRLTDARTPLAHTHPATQISDSTEVGRALLTAVDAPAGRAAISAAPAGTQINAGTGLTGGGAINASRTLALSAASIASLARADAAVVAVLAGDDLATARPAGAAIVYWVFDDPTVDVGPGGSNIVNGVDGDMWFVPDA